MVAALGLWVGAGQRGRVALAVVGALSVIALGLTLSRGGYLALAAVATIWLVPHRSIAAHAPSNGDPCPVPVCGARCCRLQCRPGARRSRGSQTARSPRRTSATGRYRRHLDLWRVGIEIAADHPLLGTGPETFPIVYRPYLDVLPRDRAVILAGLRAESPHNELIGLAAEAGLPAMLAFAAFLLAVRRDRRGGNPPIPTTNEVSIALVVLSVLAVHVVTTFFMTPETVTSALFWVIAGAGPWLPSIASVSPRRLAPAQLRSYAPDMLSSRSATRPPSPHRPSPSRSPIAAEGARARDPDARSTTCSSVGRHILKHLVRRSPISMHRRGLEDDHPVTRCLSAHPAHPTTGSHRRARPALIFCAGSSSRCSIINLRRSPPRGA